MDCKEWLKSKENFSQKYFHSWGQEMLSRSARIREILLYSSMIFLLLLVVSVISGLVLAVLYFLALLITDQWTHSMEVSILIEAGVILFILTLGVIAQILDSDSEYNRRKHDDMR